MASTNRFDGSTISDIAAKESAITGSPRPAKGGPTAQAQKRTGEAIDGGAVAAVVGGEKAVTGEDAPRAGGPAAFVQSLATKNAGEPAVAATEEADGPAAEQGELLETLRQCAADVRSLTDLVRKLCLPVVMTLVLGAKAIDGAADFKSLVAEAQAQAQAQSQSQDSRSQDTPAAGSK